MNIRPSFGVRSGNKLFNTEPLKVGREILGKIAPFRIVARKKDNFISEHIGIEVNISIDFFFNVLVLCIKLVSICGLCA